MNCAPIPAGADASLSATLVGLDCQVNGLVSGGYARLFGHNGAFNAALTTLLTIYVLLIGYTLMTGRMRVSLPSMTPKVAILALVLTFATAWPAYQAIVYGLLTGGPDQIASVFMGGSAEHGGAAMLFARRLDRLFDAMVEMGRAVSTAGDPNAENVKLATSLAWISALTTLLSTVGLLVIARIVLAVLLALGPVFVVLALFKPTRGLFEGWLKTAVGFAFVPMLVVLGGSGLISMLEPMIAPIVADPAAAVQDPRALVTLFVTSLVYAALLPTLGFVAMSLARGWRPAAPDQRLPEPAAAGETGLAAPSDGRMGEGGLAGRSDDRFGALVASVSRRDGAGAEAGLSAARLAVSTPVAANDRGASASGSGDRASGLGQSFRISSGSGPISGPISGQVSGKTGS